MSIGSTKCLQAALHGWLLHVLSVYWRVWAGVRLRRTRVLTLTLTRVRLTLTLTRVRLTLTLTRVRLTLTRTRTITLTLTLTRRVWCGAARVGGQQLVGLQRSTEPARRQALRGWLGRWEASGATRALLRWREAAGVLAGRRQLRLASEALSAQQEQWQDAMMANGAARLQSALAASRLTG